jgi:hypothetical protein
MTYFKFKLQLKLRNKNYSSIILNLHTGLRYPIHYCKIKIYIPVYAAQYITVKLKFTYRYTLQNTLQ